MNTCNAIVTFLQQRKWIVVDDPEDQISYLAAGEYNENYRIDVHELYGETSYVFRLNHGSQLGLEEQIAYEFAVLQALARSGVTPRPFYCEPNPLLAGLGKGVLLMEYLPGRHLDYEKDWRDVAAVFAAVHQQPVSDQLLHQNNPIHDIACESEMLIRRYSDHPLKDIQKRLLVFHETIIALAEKTQDLWRSDSNVIVNTEVNSNNFLVDERISSEDQLHVEKHVKLVDWEKAVVSSRFQDLAHFLCPTTTLWKTDFRFSSAQKKEFVAEYLNAVKIGMPLEHAVHCAEIMERAVLLRALSWCYMAYHEYTHADRALKNKDTFAKIELYLRDIECFFVQNQ